MREGIADFIHILLAILLPPMGVFLKCGYHVEFWTCLLLTMLGYLPGIMYAIYCISHQRYSPLPSHSVSMPHTFHAMTPQSVACRLSSKKPCYDVFINHRGKDVKHKLASTIYNTFDLMGVPAFLDQDELELGDSFPQAIEEAMCSASVHIAIFSPSYAESPWCLEELSLMLQINVTIIPVFYGVNPTDLRYAAKGIYADAFRRHMRKRRYKLEQIKGWMEGLRRVSHLSGCILNADKWEKPWRYWKVHS